MPPSFLVAFAAHPRLSSGCLFWGGWEARAAAPLAILVCVSGALCPPARTISLKELNMDMQSIDIAKLSISKANMRNAKKPPDITDILPSVKARGVLVPLLVRPNGIEGHYEIVAGRRRYFAAQAAAQPDETGMYLPCAILDDNDDAAALEASLIENFVRQDPDEVTKWETFTQLVKQGRDAADIAATFGLPNITVKRILALGNLLPRIREAYRAQSIDAATVRHLTLASKAQQKAWLALFDSEDGYAPRGNQLKAWLFGGAAIAVSAALFDIASYDGQIVSDLFEENGYFADADTFWAAQSAEIARREADYLANGWSSVEIIPPERQFAAWEYEHVSKRKGGRVYIDVHSKGDVTFHEGYMTRKEVRTAQASESGNAATPKPPRPEITAAMREYLDLHRHAAVRAILSQDAPLALRVMVAHMICGSPLWRVSTASIRSRNDAITQSLQASSAEQAIAERRAALLELLGFAGDEPHLVGGQDSWTGVEVVLARLIGLGEDDVMAILAFAMAETLTSGTRLVEYLGEHLAINMADHWQADSAFFALLRDREVLTAILAEVGSPALADAHASQKGFVLKAMIGDCLDGENGRRKCENWVPRWMAFPPSAYTERGKITPMPAASIADEAEDEASQPDDDVGEASLAA
jgi:ParB family transcriptional regulator, chromosome partitioning protein